MSPKGWFKTPDTRWGSKTWHSCKIRRAASTYTYAHTQHHHTCDDTKNRFSPLSQASPYGYSSIMYKLVRALYCNTPSSPFSSLHLVTDNLILIRCQLATGQYTKQPTSALMTDTFIFPGLCLEKQWQNVQAYFSCGGLIDVMQHESKHLLQTSSA